MARNKRDAGPAQPLYIGWDVGGWEGSHDGIAVLRAGAPGRLELVGKPVCTGLKAMLASRTFTVQALLELCGVQTCGPRVVLGVDANLGWPQAFRTHVQGGAGAAAYIPDLPGEMHNKLAYRLCECVISERCGKRPLSAPFDRLGNNTSKAIIGCELLRQEGGVALLPFDEDAGAVAVVEAYPALWKAGERKTSGLSRLAQQALRGIPLPPPGSDEMDAVLAALTAACYDNQRRSLKLGLPVVRGPQDHLATASDPASDAALIGREGWVYYPVAADRTP